MKQYLRDGRAPIPKKPLTSMIMSSIRAKGTKPELALLKALKRSKSPSFKSNFKGLPGTPDLYFPKQKLIVFINGCYWHRCPYCALPLPKTHKAFWKKKFRTNKERDNRKSNILRSMGYRVITIWECQIKRDINKCTLRIIKGLR